MQTKKVFEQTKKVADKMQSDLASIISDYETSKDFESFKKEIFYLGTALIHVCTAGVYEGRETWLEELKQESHSQKDLQD